MLPIEKGRIWMEWKCKKTRHKERERLRDEERLLPEEGEKQSERKIRYIHIERRIG